jgi:hypothetical protein
MDQTNRREAARRDITRRAALGAIGATLALGCGASANQTSGASTPDAASGSDAGADAIGDDASAEAGACAEIPGETAGPYPDKTNMLGTGIRG